LLNYSTGSWSSTRQGKGVFISFSLTDDAKDWWRDLDKTAAEVVDWNSLALAFYRRYFPPQRTHALRGQIINFTQSAAESLSEVWARFKNWFVQSLIMDLNDGLCNQFYKGCFMRRGQY